MPLSAAGEDVGGEDDPPSARGLDGSGGDCIANSSSPRSRAAMTEVLTLEDFSLANGAKLYATLKEQQPEDKGLSEGKVVVLLLQQQLEGNSWI